jgi:16S rRNA (uracil1498-N3)-methyltransferase
LSYFYCESKNVKNRTVLLVGDEAHHAARVLRHGVGDTILATDGKGIVYEAKIARVSDSLVEARVVKKLRRPNEPVSAITLAQGILKGSRMDYAVEKLTELGVRTIVPFFSKRSAVLEGEGTEKHERWRRITVAALKQSERSVLPSVSQVVGFDGVLAMAKKHDLFLLGWEEEKKNRVTDLDTGAANSVLVAIGPEGGFTAEEVEAAKALGAKTITLGQRKLRSETASVTLTALVLQKLGDM